MNPTSLFQDFSKYTTLYNWMVAEGDGERRKSSLVDMPTSISLELDDIQVSQNIHQSELCIGSRDSLSANQSSILGLVISYQNFLNRSVSEASKVLGEDFPPVIEIGKGGLEGTGWGRLK